MTIFFNMYVYSACNILGSVENIPSNIQEKHFLNAIKKGRDIYNEIKLHSNIKCIRAYDVDYVSEVHDYMLVDITLQENNLCILILISLEKQQIIECFPTDIYINNNTRINMNVIISNKFKRILRNY